MQNARVPNRPFSQALHTLLTVDDWHHFFQNYTQQSMHLNPIHVQIQDQFTDEIDQLRQVCFPSVHPVTSAKDPFDERSKHIVVVIDNILAAYGRLTPGPNAVFENWTRGQATIPTGEHVIDLGRCLVNPQCRGLGLLELVFIVALAYAEKADFKYMVGTVLPSENVGVKTAKYGFIDSGGLVYREAPNQLKILVQPILCEIEKAQPLWDDRIEQQLAFLASKGYRL